MLGRWGQWATRKWQNLWQFIPCQCVRKSKSNSEANCPPLDDVSAVRLGGAHSCALIDGGLKCWGGGEYGKRGDGKTTVSSVPVDALGERTDWKSFHYSDDAENFDSNFLLNPDDETQYSRKWTMP